MRVYLSSYLAGARFGELRARKGARAAVVLNALDAFGESRSRDLGSELARLEGLGYEAAELDLRRHFGDRVSLGELLSQLDLVWVVGGNAFVLGRAIAASGFAPLLHHRAEIGPFIYSGYSAGACAAAPDLAGLELVDDPRVHGVGHPHGLEPKALNLVPFRVVPHWDSDHPESGQMAAVADVLRRRGLEYRLLRDGESLLLDLGPQQGSAQPSSRGLTSG